MTSEQLGEHLGGPFGDIDRMWRGATPDDPRGGEAFAEFIESFRLLADRLVSAAGMSQEQLTALAADLRGVAGELDGFAVAETERWAGRRPDLPGRGSPLLPPFVITEETDDIIRATVRFRPFHIGGGRAAHGGTQPMVFDDLLGRLANLRGGALARTAYLKVNYRAITPIDVDLQVVGRVDRAEGRKTFLVGTLHDGDTLLADAEALFLRLLPGQH